MSRNRMDYNSQDSAERTKTKSAQLKYFNDNLPHHDQKSLNVSPVGATKTSSKLITASMVNTTAKTYNLKSKINFKNKVNMKSFLLNKPD